MGTNKLYREQQKMRYLKQCRYEEPTKEVIISAFKGACKVEKFYEKDLSEFNQQEVIYLLKRVGGRTRNYLYVLCSFFADYYTWCLSEKLIQDVDNKYVLEKYTMMIENVMPHDSMEERFFTKKVFLEYLDKIYAPENKLISYAIYLSILGEDFEELIHMRIEDLDEENKEMSLVTGRVVKVDDLFIELLKAANSKMFYDEDGKLQSSSRRVDLYNYIENGYVLKQLTRGTNKPVTKSTIIGRLTTIKKQSGNKSMTPLVIYKNGLVEHIRGRFDEKGMSLEEAFMSKVLSTKKKIYKNLYEEIQEYIDEFGSTISAKTLKNDVVKYLYRYED